MNLFRSSFFYSHFLLSRRPRLQMGKQIPFYFFVQNKTEIYK